MQFITRHRCWFDRMNTECFFNRCSGCVFSQLSIRPHLYTVIVLDLTFFFMFWLLNLVFCNIRSWVLLSLEEFFFGWEEWLRLVGWGGIRSLTPTSCRALESSPFLPPPRYPNPVLQWAGPSVPLRSPCALYVKRLPPAFSFLAFGQRCLKPAWGLNGLAFFTFLYSNQGGRGRILNIRL